MADDLLKVGFGGGCHWCTEAVFQSLRGIEHVAQGFVRSDAPYDSWSEAVIVRFDPGVITLDVLVEIHLRTHSSMSDHSMRQKYRSAVYVFDDEQKAAVDKLLAQLQPEFEKPLVTQVLPHKAFRYSDKRFHNYYVTNPERAFCQRYIDPKLQLLREKFSDQLRDDVAHTKEA